MKKDLKILFLITVLLITATVIVNKENKVKAESKSIQNAPAFTIKSAYDEKDDGWVYFFKIYLSDDSEKKSYVFNGYNLKYQEKEGFVIPVKNSKTGEIIKEIKPGYVSLINSKEYKQDLINIKKFFEQKQFDNLITIKDLQDLQLVSFEKKYIVSLFNRAINSKAERVNGEYASAPIFGLMKKKSTDEKLDGEWQVAYLLKNGRINNLNIEFIDADGNYSLDTDIPNKFKTTISDISKQVINIEENVILNQKFNLKNTPESNNINNDLQLLLEDLQEELNSY